jgi:hypothetical protein
MVLSSTQSVEALNHVLDIVLGEGNGSPLKKALLHEGVRDIYDFVSCDHDLIYSLMYIDDEQNVLPVPDYAKDLAVLFYYYFQYHHCNDSPIGDDWMLITTVNPEALASP